MRKLVVTILLLLALLGVGVILSLPTLPLYIAHAQPARHCLVAVWKHHHWVCTKTHKDPPPLQAFPKKVHERAGLPGEVNFTGTGLEPRTFYEFLSDLPFACDFVEVHGWQADRVTGLPVLEDDVVFDRYPSIYEPELVFPVTIHLFHPSEDIVYTRSQYVETVFQTDIFTDVGGNASFSIFFDGCVKRLDPPYTVHLVSLSGNGTEFTGTVKISVP